MSDGADQGVMPERALGTILGGKDQPSEEEKLDIEALGEKIRAASFDEDSYDGQSLVVARLVIEAIEKYPKLRDVPMKAEYLHYNDGRIVWFEDRDPPSIHLRPGMYDVLKLLHPEESSPERVAMDGLTGFMWGWAYNAAAKVLGLDQQPNPAIVEIG